MPVNVNSPILISPTISFKPIQIENCSWINKGKKNIQK